MNRLALALLCACLASPAWAAKSAVIDGKRVVLGKRTGGVPLFEVSDLKFYEAVMPKTGEACTVVSGKLLSRLNKKHFVVTVDIRLYECVPETPGYGARALLQAVIDRPEPGQRIRFVAQGKPWRWDSVTKPSILAYHVNVSFKGWREPKPHTN